MSKKISIREGSIETTARWIFANNPHLHHRPNITLDTIREDIRKCVDRVVNQAYKNWDINYSGTAGFTVFFLPEEENYGAIEILVEPCVGQREINYIYIEDEI